MDLSSFASPVGNFPNRGGASATITGYNNVTGLMTGSTSPKTLVAIAVAGTYFASVMSDASGRWSYTFTPTVVGGKVVSVVAVPAGSFLAAAAIFGTLDPSKITGSVTLSNGNLTVNSTGTGVAKSTTSHSSGYFYFESTINSSPIFTMNLVDLSGNNMSTYFSSPGSVVFGNAAVVGDVMGYACDLVSRSFGVYKSGIYQGAASLTSASGYLTQLAPNGTNPTNQTFNFGATPFLSMPSGYSAWG